MDGDRKTLDGWEIVHKHSYPHLFEAFETLSHDCGAGAGHSNYAVPKEWAPHLKTAETALSTLTNKEYGIFLTGDATEQQEIADRSKELFCTHKMLNSFFEDWN